MPTPVFAASPGRVVGAFLIYLALSATLAGCLGPEAPAVPSPTLASFPGARMANLSPVPTTTTLPDQGGTSVAPLRGIPLPPTPGSAGEGSPRRPTVLTRIGHIQLEGRTANLSLIGDRLFVAAGHAGVHIIDVSEPGEPARIARIEAIADDVAASSSFLAVLSTDTDPHVRVFEIQDIDGPFEPPEVIPPPPVDSVGPANISLQAGILILAGGSASAQFVEILGRPMQISTIIPMRKAFVRVSVFGGLVFLTEDTGDTSPYVIAIYDLSDSRRPSMVGEVSLHFVSVGSNFSLPANFPLSSDFSPPYLYVAGHGTLTIFNLADLGKPIQVGLLETGANTMHVAVEGGMAVVSNGDVLLVDVSNPAQPRRVASVNTPGNARMSVIRNGIIYVADGENGLLIMQAR